MLGMRQGKFLVWRNEVSGRRYVQSLYHSGRPAETKVKNSCRFPTRLPLIIENLKCQVARFKTAAVKPAGFFGSKSDLSNGKPAL